MKTPILETSRLWLRPLKEEDAPGAFLWTGDPKVSWYMRYETHESLEDTKQWLREEEKQLESDLLYDFGFHKKDSDELIGSGGLTFNQQQGIWELGYNLRRDCWNQGYGTEAAAAILSFAENTLHIHRVMARRAKDNTASGRVLEKNGFSFVRECWDQNGAVRTGSSAANISGRAKRKRKKTALPATRSNASMTMNTKNGIAWNGTYRSSR